MSLTGIGRIATAEKMSLQQLEEALQNKTLPAYIAIPLIDEKADMMERAQRMQALQAQQQAQNQVPIGDGVLQKAQAVQMGQGIDALPTNLPMQEAQMMAGGGIVAFDKGGPISFQNQGLVQETQEERDRRAMMDTLRRLKAAGMDIATLPGRGVAGAFESAVTRPLRAAGVPVPYLPSSFYGGDASSMTPYYDQIRRGDAERVAAEPVKPDAVIPSGAVAPPTGTPPADQGIAALPSNLQADLPKPPDVSAARSGVDKTLTDYLGRSEDREKRLMESLGRDRLQGKAFQDYEQTLRKEAEAAGAEKEEAKGMALLKAGLAMMAGTSQHALENIGKGAMVGVTDYQAAYKDLKKSERERTKEFALIEQARRAEEKGELERRDNLLMRASDAAQKRDDFGTRAIMEAGVKDADRAFDIWKTQYAGGVTLAAAQAKQRPGISATQLAKFRENAIKTIDENALRARAAKQAGLKTVPAPGANKDFDRRVSEAYEAEIDSYIQRILGGMQSSSNSLQGFRLITDEE
jgi:hypothetical protein